MGANQFKELHDGLYLESTFSRYAQKKKEEKKFSKICNLNAICK